MKSARNQVFETSKRLTEDILLPRIPRHIMFAQIVGVPGKKVRSKCSNMRITPLQTTQHPQLFCCHDCQHTSRESENNSGKIQRLREEVVRKMVIFSV